MIRLPSPAMCVALASMVVALGSAGFSATGGNFILGNSNSASTPTLLQGPIATRTLQVNNGSTTAGATALSLSVVAGHPPMKVNSATKVANLNADKLDGLNSTQFANKLVIAFNLAAGAVTAQIVVPSNQPVFLMGVTTTASPSVGHATLMRSPSPGILTWVGLESADGSAITEGESITPGDHIVFIDKSHEVEIEVNGPNKIRVFNGSDGTRARCCDAHLVMRRVEALGADPLPILTGTCRVHSADA